MQHRGLWVKVPVDGAIWKLMRCAVMLDLVRQMQCWIGSEDVDHVGAIRRDVEPIPHLAEARRDCPSAKHINLRGHWMVSTLAASLLTRLLT